MKFKKITKDIFDEFQFEKTHYIGMFSREVDWIASDSDLLIAALSIDKIDEDWSYMIFSKNEQGTYSPLKFNVSIETEEIARYKLKADMVQIIDDDKHNELLYSQEENELIIPKLTSIDDEIKKYFKKHPEKLYEISPRKFEEIIASIMSDLGYEVELTKATRDGGRDIIASIQDALTKYITYVECKRYSQENKVGVGIIREVTGVHHIRKPTKSLIVTTSFFTKDAVKEAKEFENSIGLKDYNNIKEWLERY